MSNIVQIKRGVTTPKWGHLAPYELGYVTLYDNSGKENNNPDAGYLFIGDRNQNPQKIKADYADSAATATKADSATNADKLGDVPAADYVKKEDVIGENAPSTVWNATNATNAINATNATNAENANKIKNNNNEYITFADMLNLIYPIGSIYISTSDINPGELFGGTWQQLKDKFLLAVGDTYDAGSEGGEAKHILTVDEMPSHTHDFGNMPLTFSARDTSGDNAIDPGSSGTVKKVTYTTTATGGGKAHNNMPPYLAVYMWKRTA